MYTPDFFDATCLKLYLLSNVPFNEQSKLHEYTTNTPLLRSVRRGKCTCYSGNNDIHTILTIGCLRWNARTEWYCYYESIENDLGTDRRFESGLLYYTHFYTGIVHSFLRIDIHTHQCFKMKKIKGKFTK